MFYDYEKMNERILFFLQMIKNAKRNASVTPSSRFLAKQMLKWIDWKNIHTIIELGAWTWIFTKHILNHIIPGTKIIVMEIESSYVKLLQEKFTDKIIIENTDIKNIDLIRKKYGIQKIDLIISWLPFLPAESIHNELQTYIKQGTIFRSFTYQPSVFKKFYADFPIRKIGSTCINIPPARVYWIN